jgi:phosphatidylethanolamine N-methyltransferase
MSTAADLPDTGPGLRQRQSGVNSTAQQDAQPEQTHVREPSDSTIPSEKPSKTYGRTPDGTGMSTADYG